MPWSGSQSNSSKPVPSARHSLAAPDAQLASPGKHTTHPNVSTQRLPAAAQSWLLEYPPLPSHVWATLPSQRISFATQIPPDPSPPPS